MPVVMILALMGVVFFVVGIAVMKASGASTEGFERVNARLYATLVSESIGSVEPVVDFTVDGKEMRLTCQPVSEKKVHAVPGDTVQVYVRRGKVMGLDKWTVLWDAGEQTVGNQARMRTVAGGVFVATGVILLGIALAIFFAGRRI